MDRKGSFGNTWNVKSFLLSKWLLESAAAAVVGCASSNLYNLNLALRPSFHACVYVVVTLNQDCHLDLSLLGVILVGLCS